LTSQKEEEIAGQTLFFFLFFPKEKLKDNFEVWLITHTVVSPALGDLTSYS
jgi:hypothetical protein